MSSIKEERDEMSGAIICIKFIGYYENFDEWKENTKSIARHHGIFKQLTREWEIPEEDCDGCARSKEKPRAVRKKTYTRASHPVDSIFMDTVGPFR